MEPQHHNYEKIKQILHNQNVCQTLLELVDLSTLITKNRGINYDKSMRSELRNLEKFIQIYGKEITEYDYSDKDQFKQKAKQKIGTNI
jgi:hypothetical protein